MAHRLRALAAATTLVIAGCGGGDDDADGASPFGFDDDTTTADQGDLSRAGPSDGEAPDRSNEWIGEWIVEDDLASAGYFTNALSDSDPSIEFAADGTVSGFTGCRKFTGPYATPG